MMQSEEEIRYPSDYTELVHQRVGRSAGTY